MKVFLDSIGCRLNQGEIEHMARQFRQAGHELVATPEASDLVVINSCSVTTAAAADSRAHVRRAHRQNPRAGIVLTGCWSSVEPEEAAKLPGVIHVIPNPSKDSLVPDLLGLPVETFDREPLMREPIPGKRRRTRAFIKVQDGCDNRCTFCLTTIARGAARSLPIDRVVNEVNHTIAGGAQEVVLSGVQMSAYGRDLGEDINLVSLVEAVLAHTDIPRVRLSSLEPWSLPDRFFELWQNPRLCRHLHLPLQSGCSTTLRRMGRPITPSIYADLVDSARSSIPDLGLTTDLIAGFPGETAAEFSQSLDFVTRMGFTSAHVFTYSPRPGTAAARLPYQVQPRVARQRSLKLREEVAKSQRDFLQRYIGKTLTVLWERSTRSGGGLWEHVGLSDNYLRVSALAPSNMHNQRSRVIPQKIDGITLQAIIPEQG
jgi:threonylcarbamoyladenosine tRNA methylthiotransferase MtaB